MSKQTCAGVTSSAVMEGRMDGSVMKRTDLEHTSKKSSRIPSLPFFIYLKKKNKKMKRKGEIFDMY